MVRYVLSIEGMSCKHCEKHVIDALAALAGVKRASADCKKGRADVACDGEIDSDTLQNAVSEAGYTLTDINRIGG